MRTPARVAFGFFVSVISLLAPAAFGDDTVTATKSVSGSFVQGTNVTYTIVLTNNMPFAQNDNPANEFRDPMPSALLFVSASASSGTASYLTTIDTVAWDGSIPAGGSVTLTIVATINPAATGMISNQGQTFFDADDNGSNESSHVTDDPSTGTADDATSFFVLQSGIVSATKSVTGTFASGSDVTYTIVMTNDMTVTQEDNDGPEFTDTLPDNVTLASVEASSGTVSTSDNTVLWNGAIGAGDSVTITIVGTIGSIITGEISNQGNTVFDRDGDHSNESSQPTDDPSTEAAYDATTFYAGPRGAFEFSASNYDVSESTGSFDVTVNRVDGANGAAEVSYTIAAGTAQGADFVGGTFSLSFANGETSKTFHVTIVDDAIDELDQTIALSLTDPTNGATLGAQSSATITIQDDDVPPTLSIDDVTLTEGDSGSQVATFTITKSGETELDVSITADPTLVSGTATCCGPANDWGGPITGETFPPNVNTRTVQVTVFGDVTYEDDETVIMTLTDAVNATIADGTGVLTILNNDPPPADLAIAKSDTPDPISAGSLLTYTMTVTNNGPAAAADVTMSDTVPEGTVYIVSEAPAGWSCDTPGVGGTGTLTCTIASLASGASAVFTMSVTVNESLATGTIISNAASVTTSTVDTNAANNSSTTTTTVQPVTNFTATKSVSGSFLSGGTVTYTVVLTNNMGHAQQNNFGNEFADVLPSGLSLTGATATSGTVFTLPASNIVTWNGTIAEGGAVTITITATTTATSGTIANQGNANIDTDNNGTNETGLPTDVASFDVVAATDLSITKTDTPDPISAGSLLTYTITVTNNGPTAASDVTMTDTVPEGTVYIVSEAPAGWSCGTPGVGGTGTLTCTIASLASGASAVFTMSVTVNASLATGTIISNTASVTTSTVDTNAANNSATTTTTVQPVTNFTATKTVSGTFLSGSTVTYKIVLANNMGHAQANNFGNEFADILPSGLSLTGATATSGTVFTLPASNIVTWNGTIPDGGTVTITITATITATSGTIANQGNANIDTDNNGTNETGLPTDLASFTVIPSADLSITKSDTPDPISAGSLLTYTITVTNNGPAAAIDVTMTDTIPTGTVYIVSETPAGWSCGTPGVGGTGTLTCTIASLASGASAVFTMSVTVNASLATGTIISNTATVSMSTVDTNAANNSSTTTTTVQPVTNFTATNSVSGTFMNGSTVTYTIVLTNNMGHAQQNNFGNEFADILPSGLALTGATATSGTILTIPASNVVTWNGTIANGGTVTITITATVTATSGTISNQGNASIDTDNNGTNETGLPTDDPSTATSSDATKFNVVQTGIVTSTMSVSGTFVQGTNVTYTVVMTNNMSVTQADNFGHEWTDNLPSTLTPVSVSASSGTIAICCSNSIVYWDGSIAAGGSVTLTIVATIGATATGTISNQGQTIFDRNTDGQNESSQVTDDPSTAASYDATSFTVIANQADLSLTMAYAPSVPGPSDTITYTLVVSNAGPLTATNVVVSDNRPDDATFKSVTTTQGSCTTADPVVCSIGSLANGSSATITLVVKAPSTYDGMTNSATATSDLTDPTPASASTSITCTKSNGKQCKK